MLFALPRIHRFCSSCCCMAACAEALPSTMTRVIWLSPSRKPVALLPVTFSEPCVRTTLPVQITLPGSLPLGCCCVPSNEVEGTLICSFKSDCFATTGRLATSAMPSTARTAVLALARLVRAMDCIEELQVLGVEIGAHANAIHCRGSLHDPRRLGRLQQVLLRPRGDFGRVDAGGLGGGEGDAVHVDLALQLQQAAVLVHPAVLGMAGPRRDADLLGRGEDEVRSVDVQRVVAFTPLEVRRDQLERGLAFLVVGIEVEVGQHVAGTGWSDEILYFFLRRGPVIDQHAGAQDDREDPRDARRAAVLEQVERAHSQRSRSASALPCAARIMSATSRAAP